MKRWVWRLVLVLAEVVLVAQGSCDSQVGSYEVVKSCNSKLVNDETTYHVGVLFSFDGAVQEEAGLIMSTCVAIRHEVGKVLNRTIVPVYVDGKNTVEGFREGARLLTEDCGVDVIFGGGMRSEFRRVIREEIGDEKILFYPMNHEGEDCSRNVVFGGLTPNQQLVPALEFMRRVQVEHMPMEDHSPFVFFGMDEDRYSSVVSDITRQYLAGVDSGVNLQRIFVPLDCKNSQCSLDPARNYTCAGGGGCTSNWDAVFQQVFNELLTELNFTNYSSLHFVNTMVGKDANAALVKEVERRQEIGNITNTTIVMIMNLALSEFDVPISPLEHNLLSKGYHSDAEIEIVKKLLKQHSSYDQLVTDQMYHARTVVLLWAETVKRGNDFSVHSVRDELPDIEIERIAMGPDYHTRHGNSIQKIMPQSGGIVQIVDRSLPIIPAPWNSFLSLRTWDKSGQMFGCDWTRPDRGRKYLVPFIQVGVMHSLHGPLALSEISVIQALLAAIEEINLKNNGVMGNQIVPVFRDGYSNDTIFVESARNLTSFVNTVFGCWASSCRKAVNPIFEETNSLLFYPVQYEGQECSRNIFYFGACPNQQIVPAIDFMFNLIMGDERPIKHGNGEAMMKPLSNKFYFVGSDYIFPRTASLIVKARVERLGGEYVGEAFVPVNNTQDVAPFLEIIQDIRQKLPNGGAIINALNGAQNRLFFENGDFDPLVYPVMSFSISEYEAPEIGIQYLQGHYASWNFFQSLENDQIKGTAQSAKPFVELMRSRFGPDILVNDPAEAAYSAVYLWKSAVEAARSFETDRIREAAYDMVVYAPHGTTRMNRNHHLEKFVRIGRMNGNGQFDLLENHLRPRHPEPFSEYLGRRRGGGGQTQQQGLEWVIDDIEQSRSCIPSSKLQINENTVRIGLLFDTTGSLEQRHMLRAAISAIEEAKRMPGMFSFVPLIVSWSSSTSKLNMVKDLIEQKKANFILDGTPFRSNDVNEADEMNRILETHNVLLWNLAPIFYPVYQQNIIFSGVNSLTMSYFVGPLRQAWDRAHMMKNASFKNNRDDESIVVLQEAPNQVRDSQEQSEIWFVIVERTILSSLGFGKVTRIVMNREDFHGTIDQIMDTLAPGDHLINAVHDEVYAALVVEELQTRSFLQTNGLISLFLTESVTSRKPGMVENSMVISSFAAMMETQTSPHLRNVLFGDDVDLDDWTVFAFEAIRLFTDIIRQLEGLESKTIRNLLYLARFETGNGPGKYLFPNNTFKRDGFLSVVDQRGNFRTIWRPPEAVHASNPRFMEAESNPLEEDFRDESTIDYNFIPQGARIASYVFVGLFYFMCAVIAGWIFILRKNKVIRYSQPLFMLIMLLGCVLSMTSIIFVGVDDYEYNIRFVHTVAPDGSGFTQHAQWLIDGEWQSNNEALNDACKIAIWFYGFGFVLAFSALLSKTLRVIIIFDATKTLRKVSIRTRDIIPPAGIMLLIEFILLILYTVVYPSQFVRVSESVQYGSQVIESYGICQPSDQGLIVLITLLVYHLMLLLVGNYLAYRTWNVTVEVLNESRYIGLAMVHSIQTYLFSVIIAVLVVTDPPAFFVIVFLTLTITNFGLIGFIFFPKLYLTWSDAHEALFSSSKGSGHTNTSENNNKSGFSNNEEETSNNQTFMKTMEINDMSVINDNNMNNNDDHDDKEQLQQMAQI